MTEAQVRQIVALALIPYEKRLSALEHTATLPVPAPAPTPARPRRHRGSRTYLPLPMASRPLGRLPRPPSIHRSRRQRFW
jgi:hypothetical protein